MVWNEVGESLFYSMFYRINKYKAYISSLFLLGYIGFILISLTHVHKEECFRNTPVQIATDTSLPGISGQSEENCQICQLSSSLNINTTTLILSGSLTPECLILPNNETIHQSTIVDVNCLRGPPTV